ncbi:MAG: hypothetical protein U0792_13885 [Gemmataceae bacterium]
MRSRISLALLSVLAVAAAAWFSAAEQKKEAPKSWDEIEKGIFRTKAAPYSFALVAGEKALLIDASASPPAVGELGVKDVEVLLTHHHRDTAAFALEYRKKGWTVRAPKASAEWLTPEGVAKFWADSIPLRNSRTAYFVLPVGIDGVDCTIDEKFATQVGRWRITAQPTPGHTRDHFAYLCEPAPDGKGPTLLFCGDAFTSAGKLWTPYTTDWDHWTDVGPKPTWPSRSARWRS